MVTFLKECRSSFILRWATGSLASARGELVAERKLTRGRGVLKTGCPGNEGAWLRRRGVLSLAHRVSLCGLIYKMILVSIIFEAPPSCLQISRKY